MLIIYIAANLYLSESPFIFQSGLQKLYYNIIVQSPLSRKTQVQCVGRSLFFSVSAFLSWSHYCNYHYHLCLLILISIRPEVGVTKLISSNPLFSQFFSLVNSKHMLAIEYDTHIWQVSPQLSCGDTCQIWMWNKWFRTYLSKIKFSLTKELIIRASSNPHPWPSTALYQVSSGSFNVWMSKDYKRCGIDT